MKITRISKILFLSFLTLSIPAALANNSSDEESQVSAKSVVESSQRDIKDSAITTKVKALFIREKLFGDDPTALSISVKTKKKVVYLSGTVKDPQQIDTAIRLAKSVDGVKNVESTITVKRDDN